MKRIKVFRQLRQLMRITALPLLLMLNPGKGVQAAPPGNIEDVLDKKISLVAEQKEVKTILSEISKLAEIKFVYSAQRIPTRKKVSLLVHDQRVGDVLNLLLGPLDVLYYVSGSQIVLMKRSEQDNLILRLKDLSDEKKEIPANLFFKTITGKVTNEKGEPLEGASITVKGTTRGTTSNLSGAFSIEAEVGETVEFSMVGFQPYSWQVGATNTVTVELLPLVASISEVVVMLWMDFLLATCQQLIQEI